MLIAKNSTLSFLNSSYLAATGANSVGQTKVKSPG